MSVHHRDWMMHDPPFCPLPVLIHPALNHSTSKRMAWIPEGVRGGKKSSSLLPLFDSRWSFSEKRVEALAGRPLSRGGREKRTAVMHVLELRRRERGREARV